MRGLERTGSNVHNNKSLHSSKLSFIQFVCVLGKKKGNI